MRYLKDEEFTEFFDKLGVADTLHEMLSKSMMQTKETIASNILNKVFEETYAEQSEQIAKELTNGTNTRKKGKRSSNKNP
jgi:dsDNA-binding SOS-regulon protein